LKLIYILFLPEFYEGNCKKDTWVTLWYVEKWTDKKGKVDSLYYTDDVLMRNGKIISYDEKIRRYPPSAEKK
jgi:hypothetical protein